MISHQCNELCQAYNLISYESFVLKKGYSKKLVEKIKLSAKKSTSTYDETPRYIEEWLKNEFRDKIAYVF